MFFLFSCLSFVFHSVILFISCKWMLIALCLFYKELRFFPLKICHFQVSVGAYSWMTKAALFSSVSLITMFDSSRISWCLLPAMAMPSKANISSEANVWSSRSPVCTLRWSHLLDLFHWWNKVRREPDCKAKMTKQIVVCPNFFASVIFHIYHSIYNTTHRLTLTWPLQPGTLSRFTAFLRLTCLD